MNARARELMGIRLGEESLVIFGSLLAFLTLALNVLILASVTALFLGGRSRIDLPVGYAAAAVTGVLLALLVGALSTRVTRATEARSVFVSLALFLGLAFFGLPHLPTSFLFVLYPLATSLASLTVVQAFALLSDCVDAEQAKRLLPWMGTGGTLGAFSAGAALAFLAPQLGTRMLLLFAAALCLVAVFVCERMLKSFVSERQRSLRPPSKRQLSFVKLFDDMRGDLLEDPLLFWFAVTQCALTVASTLLKFELESVLQHRLATDRITVFLGVFNLAANGSVLLVQIGLERALLRRFGAITGLISLPFLFLVAMPTLLLSPLLFTIAAARFFEHVLRFSVARTADDLVLLPVSSTKRRRAKTFIAGALAPLFVLMSAAFIVTASSLPASVRLYLGFFAGALALWATLSMRKPYLARLEGDLTKPRLTLDSLGAPPLLSSRAAVEAALEETLRATDPKRIAFALNTLAETKLRIDPRRVHALYESTDAQVREAAYVAAAASLDGLSVDDLIRAFDCEPDPSARAACAHALCLHLPEARESELDRVRQDPIQAVRAEWRARTDPLACSKSVGLADRRAALRLLTKRQIPQLLPFVIESLAQPSLLLFAVDALRHWPGREVVDGLRKVATSEASMALRKQAVVALGRVKHQSADSVLVSLLDAQSEDLRTDALRALVRRKRASLLRLEARTRAQAGVALEARHMHLTALACGGLRSEGKLRSKRAALELEAFGMRCEERIFHWLCLVFPAAEIRQAQLSLRSPDRRERAFALEALGQRLDQDFRRHVIALLSSHSDTERTQLAQRVLGLDPRAPFDRVLGLLEAPISELILRYTAATTLENEAMSVLEIMFVLRSVELFSRLSSEELRSVATLAKARRIPRDEILFREGDEGDAFYVIKAGNARVSKNGKTLAELSAGEWFGELALLDQGARTATVVALDDMEVVSVGAADFRELVDEAPGIARAMLSVLARRQARMLES